MLRRTKLPFGTILFVPIGTESAQKRAGPRLAAPWSTGVGREELRSSSLLKENPAQGAFPGKCARRSMFLSRMFAPPPRAHRSIGFSSSFVSIDSQQLTFLSTMYTKRFFKPMRRIYRLMSACSSPKIRLAALRLGYSSWVAPRLVASSFRLRPSRGSGAPSAPAAFGGSRASRGGPRSARLG